jgi:iron complex outermembrane receptor protein
MSIAGTGRQIVGTQNRFPFRGKMMNFAERKALCRGIAAFAAATIAGGAALPALAQDPAMIEEILVTARKKEESIQEVPVAVTAISASMIESMNCR